MRLGLNISFILMRLILARPREISIHLFALISATLKYYSIYLRLFGVLLIFICANLD